jgi:hypothetical protein
MCEDIVKNLLFCLKQSVAGTRCSVDCGGDERGEEEMRNESTEERANYQRERGNGRGMGDGRGNKLRTATGGTHSKLD